MKQAFCATDLSLSMSYTDSLCEALPAIIPAWFHHLLLIEFVFYIAMKLKFAYLQSIDPLEANLKAGSIMTCEERQCLWEGVMNMHPTPKDVAAYFEEWFFGVKINDISDHELRDYISWKYFDSRNQEHLTDDEHQQLDGFLKDAIQRLHGETNGSSAKSKANPLRASRGVFAVDKYDPTTSPCKLRKLQVQRRLLQQLVPQAHSVPEAQLAKVMRNITKTHKDLVDKAEVSGTPKNIKADRSSGTLRGGRRSGRPMLESLLGMLRSCRSFQSVENKKEAPFLTLFTVCRRPLLSMHVANSPLPLVRNHLARYSLVRRFPEAQTS